eukprot:6147702-Amphidinium_carterae.1
MMTRALAARSLSPPQRRASRASRLNSGSGSCASSWSRQSTSWLVYGRPSWTRRARQMTCNLRGRGRKRASASLRLSS